MPIPPGFERKQLSLTDFTLDTTTGSFGGYASTYGNVDAYGDTILRGAYAATLPKFLVDGFIPWSHDDRIPVAYPTVAREDEYGLWIEGTFHGTPGGQEARQVASERLAAGKRMGLSIGYYPVKAETGPNGTRVLSEIDLVEVSLVLAPADDSARLASIKAPPRESPQRKAQLAAQAEAAALPLPGGFPSWLVFYQASEPLTAAEVQAIWEGAESHVA